MNETNFPRSVKLLFEEPHPELLHSLHYWTGTATSMTWLSYFTFTGEERKEIVKPAPAPFLAPSLLHLFRYSLNCKQRLNSQLMRQNSYTFSDIPRTPHLLSCLLELPPLSCLLAWTPDPEPIWLSLLNYNRNIYQSPSALFSELRNLLLFFNGSFSTASCLHFTGEEEYVCETVRESPSIH